jgi:iron complex outermembrane receptor protein
MPVYTYQLPTDQLGNQYRYKVDEGWYGLYWQDQIKLPYGFNILGGLRYDYTSGSSNLNYDDGSFSLRSSAVQEKVSSRVGVLWEVRPELSLYGHYSEGLGNSNVGGFFTLPDGEKLKPEIATEWEFGAKTSLFDERITGSVAYFNLTKENIGTPDIQNPAFMKMTGEVVNRGVEVDVAGELLPGLNIIGSYAHLDSKITKDNSGNEGHRWVNTPEHSGSLWTTYSMQAGLLRGLKFGGGIFAKGARDGDLVNQYQLPGYVTVNLLTSYDWKIGKHKITTQLNVDNLLDKTYFSSSAFGANPVYYGQPRTFMGSIKVEF